jgi:hypothetical protein
MLVIRQDQMAVLARESQARFEKKLAAHFVATYPRETLQAGGADQIERVVQAGISRALGLGFHSRRQLTLFVSLMIMLGCEFDSDPQLPWANLVRDLEVKNPDVRIDVAYQEAIAYLSATAGKDCGHVVRAMLRMRDFDFAQALGAQGQPLVAEILGVLRRFSPEKFDHQGEDANRRLVELAQAVAERHGLVSGHGILLLATLMFMLGSGVDHDPMYPWVGTALAEGTDDGTRVARLYRDAMVHIEQSLKPDPAGALE